ncbi:helix-turn-helix transcriptional regulator [Campylobacter concisus]|uniref:Helix-turn-helix transcriptional regulator n=1 Tax=Campylobacter concisus TaxID=199 RepID=A0A1Y5MSK0_9BACT|nr:response regulator transcription factor [Campylobacter concisus]OUT11570.1 helix-turn-helix transcriptional regulator [Campylobacter concisus]
MQVILFTQNSALNNIWRSYFTGNSDVKFIHNRKEFFSHINDDVDIIGIDIDVFKDNIDDVIKNIIENSPNIKILILSNRPTINEGKHLLTLGIKGYANSHMRKTHFEDAFEAIFNGNIWLYQEFVQAMISELTGSYINSESEKADKRTDLSELSSREREVVDLIYQGLTNNEISEKTGITLRTVKAHTSSIYSKLNVKDRIGLVLLMKQLDA